MAKSRDLNPHYFKKPSLHFYLRIPVVLASVAWSKRRGELQSIKDVRTRDPYGLAKYAYTASHQTVLRWSRFGSVASALILIALTFILAYQLSSSIAVSAFAACTTAVSTEVLRNSYIIGVDMIMAVLCLACTAASIWTYQRFSLKKLTLCALLAGLAGSAKYNAAPIALAPLAVWYLKGRGRLPVIIPLLVPLIGLLLGSPYILVSFAEFWKDLTFELWHYGVAGHEGNNAPRGVPQAIFYGRWLLHEGVGLVPALLASLGLIALVVRKDPKALVLLSFPLAYAGLMIMQKANFTRNMVVIVPYVAILAALGLHAVLSRIPRSTSRVALYLTVAALSLVQIGRLSISTIVEATQRTDSRDTLANWLSEDRLRDSEIAVAGPLQIPVHLFALSGVDSFNPAESTAAQLAQRGYDYIVTPSNISFSEHLRQKLPQESTIDGVRTPQRVPENPSITIFRVPAERIQELALLAPAKLSFVVSGSTVSPSCTNSRESHCWLSNRVTNLELDSTMALPHQFTLEAMTPWADQTLSITTSRGDTLTTLALPVPGEWKAFEVNAPSNLRPEDLPLLIRVKRVSSPASRSTSSDSRRLGVALRATTSELPKTPKPASPPQ
jgi:hypothetical protein